jgi:hypothetical protein
MRLLNSDISPDGIRIAVDWSKFTPGASVFIPCINIQQAMDHIADASGIAKSDLARRVCVENGKYGLRVWRMK